MSKKTVILLAALFVIATLALPVQAQSEDPPPTVHVVQRGETLFSIAQLYGTTVEAIAHANGIADPREIYVGQQLIIPTGQGNAPQETTPYMVQPGDTLFSIARRYGTDWQTLVQINGLLSPNTIYVGQIIQVPASAVPGTAEVTFPQAGSGLVYIVRPGDTLARIALRHDISPWMLATINHISSPALIYPGQELIVPGEIPTLLPAPFVAVETQPLPIAQGTTFVVAVRTSEHVTLQGRLFDQTVYLVEEKGVYYGLVGVHVFTEPGLYELELTAVDDRGQSTSITTGVVVNAGRYGYERIDLPEDRTALLDPAVVAAEREQIDSVRLTFSPERRWALPFQRPCVGAISAYFGTFRAYNDGPYTSYHTGVDFRAPGGTPVYAPAAGTVVLAEPLAVRGNTIVVDHGWGLLSGYWHLSSIEVVVGQQIAQGDLIGRVGNTGLSTGAHLHWEMWVGGVSVNGLQWLEPFYTWPEAEGKAAGG